MLFLRFSIRRCPKVNLKQHTQSAIQRGNLGKTIEYIRNSVCETARNSAKFYSKNAVELSEISRNFVNFVKNSVSAGSQNQFRRHPSWVLESPLNRHLSILFDYTIQHINSFEQEHYLDV
jgi:hypothetical protein